MSEARTLWQGGGKEKLVLIGKTTHWADERDPLRFIEEGNMITPDHEGKDGRNERANHTFPAKYFNNISEIFKT